MHCGMLEFTSGNLLDTFGFLSYFPFPCRVGHLAYLNPQIFDNLLNNHLNYFDLLQSLTTCWMSSWRCTARAAQHMR